MKTAAPGFEVIVEYEGMLKNGEVFESTKESTPLHFVIGTGSVFPRFEETIIGMREGEERQVEMSPEEAFGPRKDELIQTIKLTAFGDRAKEIKEGMVLNLNLDKDGASHKVPALVTRVNEDTITVDYNHPLAGQTLLYKLTLTKIGEQKTKLPPIAPQDGP